MAAKKKASGRAAHQQPVKPAKGKSPREGGPTLADRVTELEESFGGSVYWREPEEGKVICAIDDPDGDRISGLGKTRAEAFEKLEAKVGKGGR